MNVCSNKDIMIKIRPYDDFSIYQGSLYQQYGERVEDSDFKMTAADPI